MAVQVVELQLTLVAGGSPKSTSVAPAKPEPLMVTTVPPVLGPVFGLIEETDGAGSGAGPTKVPSTATPLGWLSPEAPGPTMLVIGATLPVAPGRIQEP